MNKYLEIAKAVSKTSEERFKLGAVLVEKRQVIAIGVNGLKTHPLQAKYNRVFTDGRRAILHAEMAALVRSPAKFSQAFLYVYRETARGVLANSKPCLACQKACLDFGVKGVFYTTDGGFDFLEVV